MSKQRRNKFVLGITGNIACGKSTVARIFKTKNCLLINADILGRSLLEKNKLIYRKIKKVFGPVVLKGGGRIDREKLAQLVFTNKLALIKLNRIVHPPLIKEIKRRIKKSDKKIIILDAALIIEAGLKKIVDKLVVVKAGKKQQLKRSTKNRLFSKKDIVRRMKSQISQKEKLGFADFIIDNQGSLSKTRKQVSEIRRKLWKS